MRTVRNYFEQRRNAALVHGKVVEAMRAAGFVNVVHDEWTLPGGTLNKKTRDELLRQLTEAAHHHYACNNCDEVVISEVSMENEYCHNCVRGRFRSSRAVAKLHYGQILDAALAWGGESMGDESEKEGGKS